MKFGWKLRVSLVLSALWICLVVLVADEYHKLNQVLGIGVLPLLLAWGGGWIVSGWLAQRSEKEPVEPREIERRAMRRRALRNGGIALALLLVGLFVAVWQFKAAGNEEGSQSIANWFGEWLVWGLVAYLCLRAVPKLQVGSPLILAALLLVVGVNYRAFEAIKFDKKAVESLARAAPLFAEIQAGTQFSDEKIRSANVGMFEPLLLASSNYAREVRELNVGYQRAMGDAHLEEMLTPRGLVSASTRQKTRVALVQWSAAAKSYREQVRAATSRARLRIQSSFHDYPASLSISTIDGFDRGAGRTNRYLDELVATQEELSGAVAAMLDLMDRTSGGYRVEAGPPPSIIFQNQWALDEYQRLTRQIVALAEREQKNDADFLKAQTDRNDDLTKLIQSRR